MNFSHMRIEEIKTLDLTKLSKEQKESLLFTLETDLKIVQLETELVELDTRIIELETELFQAQDFLKRLRAKEQE